MSWTSENVSPIFKGIYGAVTGLVAGVGKAIVKIPPGQTVSTLFLKCTIAGAAATRDNLELMFGDIRVLLSGKEIFTLTAQQLVMLAEYYQPGAIADDGYLAINFQRLWMQGFAEQNGPAWGLLNQSSLILEMETLAANTIDTILPLVQVQPIAEDIGTYFRYSRQSVPVGNTGRFNWDGLDKHDPNEMLYALHFEVPTPARFSSIAFVADDTRLIDTVAFGDLYRLSKLATPPRNPQTAIRHALGYCHLDFAARNYGGDAVRMNMGNVLLEWNFITAAPVIVTVIGEYATRKALKAA